MMSGFKKIAVMPVNTPIPAIVPNTPPTTFPVLFMFCILLLP